MNKNILHLTLKKEYFDAIESGEKTSEYREYKPYWIKRLQNTDGSFKQFDIIQFRNGYSKNAPIIMVEFLNIEIIKQRISFFKKEKLFQISLGSIIQ